MIRNLVVNEQQEVISDAEDLPSDVVHLIVGPWGPWHYPYITRQPVQPGDIINFLGEEHPVLHVREYKEQKVTVVEVGWKQVEKGE